MLNIWLFIIFQMRIQNKVQLTPSPIRAIIKDSNFNIFSGNFSKPWNSALKNRIGGVP